MSPTADEHALRVAEALGAHTEAIGELKAGQKRVGERMRAVEESLTRVGVQVAHMDGKVDEIRSSLRRMNGNGQPGTKRSVWPVNVREWLQLIMFSVAVVAMIGGVFQYFADHQSRLDRLERGLVMDNMATTSTDAGQTPAAR